jgi:hypothetical protein
MNRSFTSHYCVTTYANIPSLGFVPTANGPNPVIGTWSVDKPGFDVGGGVAIGAFGHSKIFAEARWDHVFVNGGRFDYLPVSFGFRW